MKVIKNGSKFEAIGPNGEVLARSTVRASARYHGKKKLALISGSSSGAKAVIQPGGSIKDNEVIEAANKAGVSMVFTGARHFRH